MKTSLIVAKTIDHHALPNDELRSMVGTYVDDLLDATFQYANATDDHSTGDRTTKWLERRGDALQSARTRLDKLLTYLVECRLE